MRKNTLNFLVDAVSLVVMFGIIATGLMIKVLLPPGTGGRHGGDAMVIRGWTRHDWGWLHWWLAVALGLLLVVHLALHWTWICTTVRRLLLGPASERAHSGRLARNLYGIAFVGSVVAIFAVFMHVAASQVETIHVSAPRADGTTQPAADGREDRAHGQSPDHGADVDGVLIDGAMTLEELVSATGVSREEIQTRLGLPADVDPRERLGRLARRHGFTMPNVRTAVRECQASRHDR